MSGRSIAAIRARLRARAMDRQLNPRDADLLLAHAIDRPLTFILAHGEDELSDHEIARVESLVARRLEGEPVQYLRGFTEFYGRDFVVDSRVLIPRPETEFVVDAAIDQLPPDARVVDIGTGSGCIAVTLKLERPEWTVFAADISPAALAVARGNALRLGAQVHLVASDVTNALSGKYHAIVSNPPYIPAAHVDGLQREIRNHEPYCALTPGEKGTEVIERLFVAAHELLLPEGVLIFEIGYSQEATVRELAGRTRIDVREVVADLAGIPRVVVARAG